jgi:hypothetical protein
MSRPEDIPESVWLEAGMLFDRLYDAEPNLEGGCYQGVTDTIARAIMAERERAAKLCEDQAKLFSSDEYAAGQPLSSFSERFACYQCAKAIRGQS